MDRTPHCFVLVSALAIASASARAEPQPHLQVPPGFTVELAAGPPQVQYPMFAVFDDEGRLFVAESSGLDLYAELQAQTRKCRVRLLEDRDADGRFEGSRVFADDLVFPMGLAWRSGKLYVADPPDLVALEDTDGDGTADKRMVVLTGFGHRDNGSLHGLIFGPDGWLYMTMGSPDGYRLERPDGSVIEGESGALIRCRPDGSEPHVVCRGFENLVEVIFTPRGEMIGTDNWFRNVNRPGSHGLRDALVHLIDGGLYPYHADVGTPQPITGEPLGPVSLFPAVALSGLVQYEGAAFGEAFQGNLFSAQHNSRKVGRHVLLPEGSTFRAEDHDFLTTAAPDFHPSDVLQAADGSLLVVDTGSWYTQHCPTGNIRQSPAPGGIYRVRREHAPPIRDAWGNVEDWSGASQERLIELLSDARPAVRDRAQLALIARGETAVVPLVRAMDASADIPTKQQVVWTLAQVPATTAREALMAALNDVDDVAATAARAWTSLGDPTAEADLQQLLERKSLHVRLAAAEALAHCGTQASLPVVWRALAGEPDRFLEHALIYAAHRLAGVEDLQAALGHERPRIQKAAILLLNQPPRPPGALSREAVLARISASDPELQHVSVGILQQRLEWIESAVALVQRWLRSTSVSARDRQSLHDMVVALQAEPPLQALIASVLRDTNGDVATTERKVDLLRTLAECTLAPPPSSWVEAIRFSIEHADAAIRAEAVRTAAVWQLAELDEPLGRIAASSDQPTAVRMDALFAVIGRRPELSPDVFAMLMEQLADDADPLARLGAAELAGRARLSSAQLKALLARAERDALISPSVLVPALQESGKADASDTVFSYLKHALEHGWRPPESQLRGLVESLPASDAERQELVAMWEQNARDMAAGLAAYEPLLTGGDSIRGRTVFFGKQVACASCHRVGSEGGDVGPDLTRIGTVRSGPDLLESIVLPSSTFAQNFESYIVTTIDGRTLTGVLARQTSDLLVLRDSSGGQQRIVTGDIDTMDRHTVSLMPAAFPQAMTRQEFQDLLAYLQSLQ